MKRSNPEEHPRSQGFSQYQEKVWEQVCEKREVKEMEVGGGGRGKGVLACVASVSVWFRSKGRPRNGILGFGRARSETRGL